MATANMNGDTTTGDVWEMTVPSGGGDYATCPAGNHPAILVGLFDIGHQADQDTDGQPIERRKLVLCFELSKKQPDGKPFVLGRLYTWSMSEKSNFYKDVSAITGTKLPEGAKFSPPALLGVPVMVSVTNSPGKTADRTYHNVGGVAQFPEGFPAPTAVYTPIAWTVLQATPFPAGLEWLPYIYGKTIRELADSSSEARRRTGVAATPAPAVPGTEDSPF